MTKTCWEWNNAIGRATFNEDQAGRVVYLAIDREEIEAIGRRELGLDASEAYESFRNAVIVEIADGWTEPNLPLRGPYPAYLALLAAQVVAAF